MVFLTEFHKIEDWTTFTRDTPRRLSPHLFTLYTPPPPDAVVSSCLLWFLTSNLWSRETVEGSSQLTQLCLLLGFSRVTSESFLTKQATLALVRSLVISGLAYCVSLLADWLLLLILNQDEAS